MSRGFSWFLFLFICALAGLIAGYGIVRLFGMDEVDLKNDTQDNTLTEDYRDGVFFDDRPEVTAAPTVPITGQTAFPSMAAVPEPAIAATPTTIPVVPQTPTEEILPMLTLLPEVTVPEQKKAAEQIPETTVSGQPVSATPTPVLNPTPVLTESPAGQKNFEETVTYPLEIFGQTPVVNRSDAYVTYFEFAIDLMEVARPVAERQGLSETSMLAKFVLKALFCGVNVKNISINEPISRKEAALTLWIATQVLGEKGTDTKAGRATDYAGDVSGCSSSEKKAIVYLYEQGFVTEQVFMPEKSLQTGDGMTWLIWIKQLWN